MQNGLVIFELSDGIRLFPVDICSYDTHVSIGLHTTYGGALYAIQLVFYKSDGHFIRNNLRVFTQSNV